MSNVKTIAIGVVMVVVGLVLRFYGGDTEIGPFELQTVGNVVAIIGGVEIVVALAYVFFPGKNKKLD
ncbi:MULTISPECIES: hypothetical protein [Saccharopolyspora]|uniref:DUF3098 domain-containing protein n=1 Tax=Saccharopolyspora cebuensis TaxID=418759 RepID=A0ABV4CHR9_9PSEU